MAGTHGPDTHGRNDGRSQTPADLTPDAAGASVRAGTRVGEWVLRERVGGGAFGEVWKACHHVWADEVAAVKIPTDPAYVRALQAEGVTTHRLEHPNVVRPVGMDPFAEIPYLVMEYVPGSDLRRRLDRDGRLPPAAATSVMRQVLSALVYAHGRGLVHRDVKPENILLHAAGEKGGFADPGTVKLADFGLGTVHTDAGSGVSIALSREFAGEGPDATRARRLAGTLDYLPPEVRAGRSADPKGDVWACGVVLYEMLTGEKPAGTEVPSQVNPEVPAWLDAAFRGAYARWENRFASAADFLAALRPPVQSPGSGRVFNAGASYGLPVVSGQCPRCVGRVEKDDQFCMHCGQQLVGAVRRCGRCGAFPAPGDRFCIFCGGDVDPRAASPTQDLLA